MEHIQNPYEFLSQLKDANGGGGRVYIEVPCFEWICEHRAWFDIFYEHVNYFRRSDFNRMFGIVVESGKLATLKQRKRIPDNDIDFPNDFADGTSPLNRNPAV